MDDTYRWELIDMLKSARLADWLITQPDINQRLFIDAAKLLEEDAEAKDRAGNDMDRSLCSGQRGIYQELKMTDEERQKLLAALDRGANDSDFFGDYSMLCEQAADEIERLAEITERYKKLFKYVDGQKTTLARIHYSWLASAVEEIERLVAENKELKKTLHHFLRDRETDMGTAE